MPKWINGKKSYIGFIGLGALLMAKGLGLDDNVQALAIQIGFPAEGNAWTMLAGFFGSLAGVGVSHKMAKTGKT